MASTNPATECRFCCIWRIAAAVSNGYIGLDVHKKTISYCVKDGSGGIESEGAIPATRLCLDRWRKSLPHPWTAAMEATIFTGCFPAHHHGECCAFAEHKLFHHSRCPFALSHFMRAVHLCQTYKQCRPSSSGRSFWVANECTSRLGLQGDCP